MFRSTFLMLAVLACLCLASPRQRQRPLSNTRLSPRPTGNDLLVDAQIGHLLRNSPRDAILISSKPQLSPLTARLISNYTEIREDVVDTFKCEDKKYGYYADQDNECQVFHVCLPMNQLYPANFTKDVVYTFSFICPKYTLFSQDSLTCAWETSALPCDEAHQLYNINEQFFKIVSSTANGTVYAELG